MQIGIAVTVGVLLVIGGVRWYYQSRDATASRQFYGADELFKRQQWEPAQQSFADLAKGYGSTPYGNLARLYAGRAALNANHPGDAVPFLTEFVAAPPSVALEQIGRIALARALEATSNTGGAREQLGRAIELDGPLRPEAMIGLARIEEADGSKDGVGSTRSTSPTTRRRAAEDSAIRGPRRRAAAEPARDERSRPAAFRLTSSSVCRPGELRLGRASNWPPFGPRSSG